jgi:phosphatidylinositol alpha-1,6-mannosyltransferase
LGRFDIIHLHNLHHWGLDETVLGGAKLVVSTYGTDVTAGPASVGTTDDRAVEMKRATLRLADQVTATSRFLARATAAYGDLPLDRVEVIHFGVDSDRFCPSSAERTREGSVGFVGGFRETKGASRLIEELGEILARFPKCSVTLLGNGETLETCRARVTQLGLDANVAFERFVSHEALPSVMDSFDVLAVPSVVDEAYCVAAVEAQSMEVPVVANRVGGLSETVMHERTGLLVEARSSGALAKGICSLLACEDRRRAFGRAGRDFVARHHAWQTSLDRMIAVYERALASGGSPGEVSSVDSPTAVTCE